MDCMYGGRLMARCQSFIKSSAPSEDMAPSLARSAPGEINHWWGQLRFRLQNKKGWNELLDEMFLLQNKLINDIPLFYATKKNNVGCIKKLLDCASTNVFERGALGETALHVGALNDNLDAAVALMDGVPELINEPMSSDLFQGITALHIAVVNQNINLVCELIRRGADVTTPRVTGMYFRKRRGGLLYYGEHILAFASCLGNEDIISMLITAGANIRAQDSLGNTILHILVLQPNRTIACQVMDLLMSRDLESDPSLPLDMVPNYRGLTPFKLAAKEGNVVAFQHLVNRRKKFQMSLGPLTSNLYDLTEIDSRVDDLSVLELIVSSQRKEARAILDVTPVRQLISLKWNLYGKHYFRFLLSLYLLYIGTFTLCCMFRPLKDIPENYTLSEDDKTVKVQKTFKESYVSYEDHLRLAGEIISVLGAIIILLLLIPDILRVGAKPYFGQSALGGPFHVILICYATLVVFLCVLRVSGLPGESVLMPIALVLGWSNVLYFARGFQMLGPYVIMIQKIIFGDLIKFMWLTVIVLIGFSTALWTVYMTQDQSSMPSYHTYPITLFSLFELTVGLIDLPVDHTIFTPPIVHVLLCCFSVISNTLLLNVLIAMMTDTQWRVANERNELWRMQVLATTLMLERRMPRALWPRLGVCGLDYGLGDHWYIRVEDRNDLFVRKMRRYVEAFTNDDKSSKVKETAEKNAISGDPGAQEKGESDPNSKSLQGWEKIRRSALGLGLEREEHVDEPDVEFG